MGRELRRVAAGWEHPRDDKDRFLGLFDESFEEAMAEWLSEAEKWMRGEAKYQRDSDERTWEGYVRYKGVSPNPEDYRPYWTEEERTHYQVYETVSEGTPVSPAFDSIEGVIEWWVNVGDDFNGRMTREQAERWVEAGGSPSMIVTGNAVRPGTDIFVERDTGEKP